MTDLAVKIDLMLAEFAGICYLRAMNACPGDQVDAYRKKIVDEIEKAIQPLEQAVMLKKIALMG